MLTLIKQCHLYSPEDKGIQDILIAGEKICAIDANIEIDDKYCQVIDAKGKIVHPGLVDSLVHISGGGGEGGFHTRTPEMQLSEATLAGVTTVVGALGTDATTRSLADLVAKAKALTTEGISAYCYTGSYHLPAVTLTGSVTDDIALIDPIIGLGEVAIADHRGSQPDYRTLATAASNARVGGMLGGKSGVTYIHVGEAAEKLGLLHDVVANTPLTPQQFYPTHINRNQGLIEAGIEWTKLGGVIDMTASTNQHFIDEGEIPAAAAIAYCIEKGVPLAQLAMSSDGNASLPVFDQQGRLKGLEVGRVASLHDSLCELAFQYKVPLSQALHTVTRTPAHILGLAGKGEIKVGSDADLVICSTKDLLPTEVLAKGRLVVSEAKAEVKGNFE